jgi:pyruvate dehydrogenase E1 component alpha subunit
MKTDLWYFYENMLRSRLFEEEVTRVWNEGKISGEMHLSIGEEAIVAGTVMGLLK